MRRRDEDSCEGFLASLVRFERAQAAQDWATGTLRANAGPELALIPSRWCEGVADEADLLQLLDALAMPAATCEVEPREVWRRMWRGLLDALMQALPGTAILVGDCVVAGFPTVVVCGIGGTALLIALARESAPIVADLVADVNGLVELVADYELLVCARVAWRDATAAWLDTQSCELESVSVRPHDLPVSQASGVVPRGVYQPLPDPKESP